MAEELFSVWLFFPDGTHYPEAQLISAEQASWLVLEVIRRPAARIGAIERVIITDGGDYTNWEWKFGQGVIYPPPRAVKTDESKRTD